MASTAASQILRGSFAAMAYHPMVPKVSSGVGSGIAPTSAPTGGGERAVFGGDGSEEGLFGLPTPVVVGVGAMLAATIGLVVYKLRKKR